MKDFGDILKSDAEQSRLHEPLGELVEKVAKGIGNKDGQIL